MYKDVEENNYWISFSDLMTGLMVIFLFIAINYIIQVIENKFVSQEIYNQLKEQFDKEIEKKDIELSPNGTMRFRPKDNKMLFSIGSPILSRDFKKSLDDFIPRYIEIITDSNYIEYISEIRIEGHTDTIPPRNGISNRDSYSYNLDLSSKRAQAVLNYFRKSSSYQELSVDVKKRLEFLLTANGLSFSRALNSEKEVVYTANNKTIDNTLSRRVEFKIVTSNEKLAEKILNFEDE